MRSQSAASLPALVATLWLSGARPAYAADPTCSPLDLQADDRVRSRWPGLVEHIEGALAGRDDLDPCAWIQLAVGTGSTLVVTVVLADGRSASRTARADDVPTTLEALLLVPRIASTATPVPAPAAIAASPAAPAGGPSPPTATARDVLLAPPPSSHFGIELSAVTDARAGNGQAGLGFGASSLIDVGGWLGGFEGRFERYQMIGGGLPAAGALELSALVGRRLRLQTMTVDLLAGPALALRGAESKTVATPGGTVTSETSMQPVPRALCGAHLSFAAPSVLRGFVGLEGEVGPTGVQSKPSSTSGLPIWTVGIALGATVGTP
jgi:hypothetical protein